LELIFHWKTPKISHPEKFHRPDGGKMNRFLLIVMSAFAVLAAAGQAMSQPRDGRQRFDCLIEPHLRLKLATPVAGVLKDVLVDRGSVVRKGQVVAQLESAVEEANVELAAARAQNDATVKGKQVRIEFLKRKRDRTAQLQARGSASEVALDEVETDLRIASQELREAEYSQRLAVLEHKRAVELMRQRSIASPIDGIIVERNLGSGEYAYEQAPITTVAQIDPLNVEVYVPVAIYGGVKVGEQATVWPEEPVGGAHQATIDVVDRVFDARSGTFGVRLKLPNPGGKIPGGLRCKLQFAQP
jgi:RND family efflux transporter MFP subunit